MAPEELPKALAGGQDDIMIADMVLDTDDQSARQGQQEKQERDRNVL